MKAGGEYYAGRERQREAGATRLSEQTRPQRAAGQRSTRSVVRGARHLLRLPLPQACVQHFLGINSFTPYLEPQR